MSRRTSIDANMSIIDLPALLTHLFKKIQSPLLLGTEGSCKFSVRYLRRKPKRNLVIVYSVDEMRSSHKTGSNYPNHSISLILDEHVLHVASMRFTLAQAQEAWLEPEPSGALHARDIGLSVQAFPVDKDLPALAMCCDTISQSPLFEALQSAAQVQLGDPTWQLIQATAQPVRYKPASRCVISYHLQLEQLQHNAEASHRTLTLFGKVYADPEQARNVQLLQQLYEEQERTGEIPLLPRSLGSVDALGLTLSEAVQPGKEGRHHTDGRWSILRTGTRALQPQLERGHGGTITKVIIPDEELCLADPALDVGYFLAYLRPVGLWYRRPGMRQWFETAAEIFRSTYCQAMLEHGVV